LQNCAEADSKRGFLIGQPRCGKEVADVVRMEVAPYDAQILIILALIPLRIAAIHLLDQSVDRLRRRHSDRTIPARSRTR
jgi:hypothetical protein